MDLNLNFKIREEFDGKNFILKYFIENNVGNEKLVDENTYYKLQQEVKDKGNKFNIKLEDLNPVNQCTPNNENNLCECENCGMEYDPEDIEDPIACLLDEIMDAEYEEGYEILADELEGINRQVNELINTTIHKTFYDEGFKDGLRKGSDLIIKKCFEMEEENEDKTGGNGEVFIG